MQIEGLLAELSKLWAHHGYSHRSAAITSGLFASAEEVDRFIAESPWDNAPGWISRQSGLVLPPHSDDSSLGAVLDAELGTEASSLQIRRLKDRWAWTLIEDSFGGAQLSDDIVLVNTAGQAARYRRYWTLTDNGDVEAAACRLVGLEEIE